MNSMGIQSTKFGLDLPSSWADSCVNIIETLDDPELPRSIAVSLATLVSFDDCRQIVYSASSTPPIVVFDGLQERMPQLGMANYLSSTYVLNPSYRMFRSGVSSGAYRVRDIAHFRASEIDAQKYRVSPLDSEEMGYLTEGMPAGNEELCIALQVPDGACATISVTRKRSSQGYRLEEVERMAAIGPFLTAAFKRYWRRAQTPVPASPEQFKLLSPREREIAELLIDGHSTLSISMRLDISGTTVKTHRKNLYAKLGIATQYELFSLYNKSLQRGLTFSN
jgi:DNA-binding CsgD family transcriptional regulator